MASGSDNFLKREGNDVYCTVQLFADELKSGVRIRVKTISGDKAELDIPAGTRAGTLFRLQGFGYGVGVGRGDQFVCVEERVSNLAVPRGEVAAERYRKVETRRQAPWYGARILIAAGLAAFCIWSVFSFVVKLLFSPAIEAESSSSEIVSPFIQKQKGSSFVCAESTVVIVNNRERGDLKFQYRIPGQSLPGPSFPYADKDGWIDCVTRGEEYFAFLFREPGEIKFSRWTKVSVESQLPTDRVRIVSLKHYSGVSRWDFSPVVSVYVDGLTADQTRNRLDAVLREQGELINVGRLEKDDFYFFTVDGYGIDSGRYDVGVVAPIEIIKCSVWNTNRSEIYNPGQWVPLSYEDANNYVARRLEWVNVAYGSSQRSVVQIGCGIPVTGSMQGIALAYKAGIGELLKVYRLRARR